MTPYRLRRNLHAASQAVDHAITGAITGAADRAIDHAVADHRDHHAAGAGHAGTPVGPRRRTLLRNALAGAAPALAAALLMPSLVAAPQPAAAQATQAPQAARYEIDPSHLSIGFLVEHIGYEKVLGMFLKGRGSYVYDEAAGALSELRVEVETESVFTNQRQRDSHLRSDDFLKTTDHPLMVFTATAARRTGERSFEVPGQLQLRGKTLPLTLQATVNKLGASPLPGKPYVMGVSVRGSLKRSAWGLVYGVDNGWVGDEVALIIEFEAIRR